MKKWLVAMLVVLFATGCHFPLRENTLNSANESFVKVVQLVVGVGPVSQGSGYVVRKTTDGAYLITAAHVCDIDPRMNFLAGVGGGRVIRAVETFDGDIHEAHVVARDPGQDICLMYAHGLNERPVELAGSRPSIGEPVYSISAPRGLSDPDSAMMVVTSGLYSGVYDGYDAYSMTISFGSSGGMVVNGDGELIGMTNAKVIMGNRDNYDSLTFGPQFKNLVKFLDENLFDRKEEDSEKDAG